MAKRSSAQRRAQKEGKVRDNYTCQACGSKKDVEGHHILDHQFSERQLLIILFLCVTTATRKCTEAIWI